MGNMFCHTKISASTMYNSDGSASLADEQSKDVIQGFITSLEISLMFLIPQSSFPKHGLKLRVIIYKWIGFITL